MGAGVEICTLRIAHCLCTAPAGLAEATAAGVFGATVLGLLAAAAAVFDLRRMRVPDAITFMIALCGVIWLFLEAGDWAAFRHSGLAALARAMLWGAALLLLRELYYRRHGRDGLGLGDVKLCAAAAFWLPLDMLAAAILAASTAALASVVLVQVAGVGWQLSRRIPLAVYLAPAIWLAFLAMLVCSG